MELSKVSDHVVLEDLKEISILGVPYFGLRTGFTTISRQASELLRANYVFGSFQPTYRIDARVGIARAFVKHPLNC